MKKQKKKVSYVKLYREMRKEKQQQKMEDWLWLNVDSKQPRMRIVFEKV